VTASAPSMGSVWNLMSRGGIMKQFVARKFVCFKA